MINTLYVKLLAIIFAIVLVFSFVTITSMRKTIKELENKPADTVVKVIESVKRDTAIIYKRIYITRKIYEKKVDIIRHEPDSAVYARLTSNLAKRFDLHK